MRKVFKTLGAVLGVVVLLIAGLLGFLSMKKPAQRCLLDRDGVLLDKPARPGTGIEPQ